MMGIMDEAILVQRMDRAIENVRQDIATIRTGRATPSLISDLVVSVYGGQQKLRLLEISSITAPDTQSLLVTPWDKSIIGDIRKGIEAANIGLNPVISGEEIRINLPPLTQEDRERYVKMVGQKLEVGKVQVRQIRQDEVRSIRDQEKAKEISEDQTKMFEKKLQEVTDSYIAKIEELGRRKEQELRSL
jgi:ribosome recycling factor